ncbi:MAG: hypothetical protein QW540_07475 [Archaeoglobaceae archaeon]
MKMMISGSVEVTTTDETEVFSVPRDYIAYLKRLEIVNKAASLATVQIKFYNGASSKVVMNKTVAANEMLVLAENELPLEACPTKITVVADQQPYRVDFSVVLV